MSFTRLEKTVTVDASGDATVYFDVCSGFIHSIRLVDTDLDANTDFVFTVERTTEAILTLANKGATFIYYPRAATCDILGAASLYAAAGEPVEARIALADDRIKLVVDEGGVSKYGIFYIIIADN